MATVAISAFKDKCPSCRCKTCKCAKVETKRQRRIAELNSKIPDMPDGEWGDLIYKPDVIPPKRGVPEEVFAWVQSLTPLPYFEERPKWQPALDEAWNIGLWNQRVLPLMRERGKDHPFTVLAVQESKRRAYLADKQAGLYVETEASALHRGKIHHDSGTGRNLCQACWNGFHSHIQGFVVGCDCCERDGDTK
jgi:hypothetical protein